MDLEVRLDKLEERVEKIEQDINGALSQIKTDIVEIKQCLQNADNTGDLKNQLIEKDVKSNSARLKKLEDNQSKFVWAIILEIIGVISAAVVAYLKIK